MLNNKSLVLYIYSINSTKKKTAWNRLHNIRSIEYL